MGMFKKADFERALYARASPEIGSSIEKMAKIGAVSGMLYTIPKAITKLAAYGIVDRNGNYVCDSHNLGLEKLQYETVVNALNNGIADYKNSFPGATNQQLHNTVMGAHNFGQNYVDLMYKMQDCLRSNNIDPSSVAQPSHDVLHAIAVPEFGPIAAAIMAGSIFFGILASKYLGRFF